MEITDNEPAIDSPQEPTPIEILCLGMCRTGTQSLAEGLRILGYGPIYHMKEVKKHGHVESWIAALSAKYEGKGTPYNLQEFDQLLGNWAGVSDIPAALFAEELMDAYPDAKIIMTSRDEQKWFDSMKLTIWHSTHASPLRDMIYQHVWGGDPDQFGITRFREHNDNVRELAKRKGRTVLEYEVKHGWEPLCEFLGKEIPHSEFPRADDWAGYKAEVLAGMAPKDGENA